MSTYIEFKMDDGSIVYLEAESSMGEVVKACRNGVSIVETGKKFTKALASIRGSLRALIEEMDAPKIEGMKVKLGLKAIGEAGFAVGKVGGEMNHKATLHWKKPREKPKQEMQK